jgi:dTDP-4-dehydrorhamnose reductase
MAFPYERVIVIGGTGQTGRRVVELLYKSGVPKIVAPSHTKLDLEGDSKRLEEQLQAISSELTPKLPTAVVLAAAFTNVEVCETDPEKCDRINVKGTAAVLDWAKRTLGAKLVFYSTDYVFDGTAGPYGEGAQRNALSKYGQAKVAIEEWLERNAPDALILRTTGVYDDLAGSKNFFMNMLDLWKQGKTTRIPRDQSANPIWARDLAYATVELLRKKSKGVFHVAGGAQMPRTEFALAIARAFGTDEKLIESVLTSDLGQKAKRPLKGGLICEKLRAELGWAPMSPDQVFEIFKRDRASCGTP